MRLTRSMIWISGLAFYCLHIYFSNYFVVSMLFKLTFGGRNNSFFPQQYLERIVFDNLVNGRFSTKKITKCVWMNSYFGFGNTFCSIPIFFFSVCCLKINHPNGNRGGSGAVVILTLIIDLLCINNIQINKTHKIITIIIIIMTV